MRAVRRSRFTTRSPSPFRRRTSADWNCTRGSIRSAPGIRSSKSPVASNHITKTHPEWVRNYGGTNLARPRRTRGARLRSARHHGRGEALRRGRREFDDYFYPYPVKNAPGRKLDFPDDASWKKYGVRTGLTRDDWRRQNVNQFVQSVYQSIKAAKPWVKFGISPFGIWRPTIRRKSRAWTPTRAFTPIRASGSPAAGWIISRRNFTGRWTRRSKVFRPAQLVESPKREGPPSLARLERLQRRQGMGAAKKSRGR